MFEQELELEEHEGRGIGPIFIIAAMVVILVGGVGYMVYQSNRTLKTEEATQLAQSILKDMPAATAKFHTGRLTASADDSVDRPNYKLLADAGIITIKLDKKKNAADIAFTPAGEELIRSVPQLESKGEPDGTTEYTVPLATRSFVKVENIAKQSPSRFIVTYTWKWNPNKVGNVFDASGDYVKTFNTWDRSQLIDKYGADFYNAAPSTETVAVNKTPDGWEIARD